MNIALCEYAEKKEYTAGNKARTDAVSILVQNGYRHVPLFNCKSGHVHIMFQILISCIKTIFLARKNDTVFMQYPYYPFMVNKVLIQVLCIGRRIKKYRIGLLIHDSMGLRNINNKKSSSSDQVMQDEVELLDRVDFVICHNDRMIDEFHKAGGNGDYRNLGPFDYLYGGKLASIPDFKEQKTIIIAGNLSQEKCGYVYQLSNMIKNCKFNLYGVGYENIAQDRVNYNGSFAPEELIEHLNGHFGLVWDGESCETCSGAFGEYLLYNNPHKFSLYLAAGMPLIVWSKSALADYVKENNIGICVESLLELDDLFLNITELQYEEMRNNVMQVREEIIKGEHLGDVLY